MASDHGVTSGMVSSSSQHGQQHTGSHGHDEQETIFFVILSLLVCAILREVYKQTKIPYTPMVVVFGIMMEAYKHLLGPEESQIEKFDKMNPHLLLFIFIPVLIFESALNMDYYIFKQCFVNCLVLAGPGVLITAVLIAFTLRDILGYTDEQGITWAAAMTIGCIAGATDPVAVVALLKELGAPARFNVLIEGQSLMNDGSAMVFFDLFLMMVKGEEQSFGDVLVNFVRLAVFGPVLGVVIGIIATSWLHRVIRDDVLTSLITVLAGYFCFYLAEYTPLKVSGILAVMGLGVFFSAVGKTKIYHESEHAMHVIWSFVQYTCESLLFLFTGILIGYEFIYDENIVAQDWINVVLLWFFMIIIRLIMLFIFYPLYQFGGYDLTARQVIVMGYGGLRGALGLCLALIVGVDSSLIPRFRALTVFCLAGVATLTLVVNGLTAKFIVEKLRIINFPEIKIRILKNTLSDIMVDCKMKVNQLKADKYLSMAQWSVVESFYSLKAYQEDLTQLEAVKLLEKRELNSNLDVEAKRVSLTSREYEGHSLDEILTEVRYISLRTMKALTWEKFETSELSADCSYTIDDAICFALDTPDQQIHVWRVIVESLSNQWMIKHLNRFKEIPVIGPYIRKAMTSIFSSLYELSTVYIEILQETDQVITNIPVKVSCLREIQQELHEEVTITEEFIMHMATAYPEIMNSIQTQRASIQMLHHVQKHIDESFNTGYIEYQDYMQVRSYLDGKTLEIENMEANFSVENFDKTVLQFPVFVNLSNDDVTQIIQKGKKIMFPAGTSVCEQNALQKFIYLVISGVIVDKITSETKQICTPGSVIGASSIIGQSEQSFTQAQAQSDATVLAVPIDEFTVLVLQNKKLKQNLITLSIYYFIKLQPENASFLGNMNQKLMMLFLSDAELEIVQANNMVEFKYGAIILNGVLTQFGNQEVICQRFHVIDTFDVKYVANQDTEILRFNSRAPDQSAQHDHHIKHATRVSIF